MPTGPAVCRILYLHRPITPVISVLWKTKCNNPFPVFFSKLLTKNETGEFHLKKKDTSSIQACIAKNSHYLHEVASVSGRASYSWRETELYLTPEQHKALFPIECKQQGLSGTETAVNNGTQVQAT